MFSSHPQGSRKVARDCGSALPGRATKRIIGLAASGGLMVFSGPASASVFNVFDFSFSGASYDGMGISLPAVSGSGEFDTMSSSSPYTVTGISGVTDGSVITGLSPYAGADQLLWAPPNPGSTDFSGISYSTASGTDFNLYYWGSGQWGLKSSFDPIGYPQDGQPISLTVTAV